MNFLNKTGLLLLFLSSATFLIAQNVGINTTSPDSSAVLDLVSNSKGFLPPRMSSNKRNAIAQPANGLVVFDNTTASYWYYANNKWNEVGNPEESTKEIFQCGSGTVKEFGNNFYGSLTYFPTTFDTIPVMLATIDESIIGSNGTTISIQKDPFRNRSAMKTDAVTDGMHWLGIKPGVHTISGKTIVAGRIDQIFNNGSFSFGHTFATPPKVFIIHLCDYGPYKSRLSSITTTGATIWSTSLSTGSDLFFVAMESGYYETKDYRWYVNHFAAPSNANNEITLPTSIVNPGITPYVFMTVYDTDNDAATYARILELKDTSFKFFMDYSTSEYLQWMAVVEK